MPRSAAIAVSDSPPSLQGQDAYAYVELDPAAQCGSAMLAEECALAIAYNGIGHGVMMVSPSAVEDFVIGFSLSSAVVNGIEDIYDLRVTRNGDALNAEVQISNRAFWALKQQRRQLAGTSGCGLCGVAALEQALPQLRVLPPSPLPAAEHLHDLRTRIAGAQSLARHSGALHAALFVDQYGEIGLCREDIGRHNALDKLIGALRQQGRSARQGFVVITSRCSLELIHKAVRGEFATLVSLSAPTSLSVRWAREHRLNLIHLPHHSAPRVYSPAR
ncbi:MAG: formate dehydrogenase accessory sulfurtransferase FdhD [Pseudomonas sp.]